MDIHFPSNLIYLNLKKNLLEQVLYSIWQRVDN